MISKKAIKKNLYSLKPEIIIQGNLRYIKPYEFKYQLWVKGRWVNRKLLEVMENEFVQYSHEYFVNAIKEGKILINNEISNSDYTLKSGDFLTHSVTRKENPIINTKLDIIFEDASYLAVDKPSSWPVHVCGGYQFNTLHRILMDEYGYKELKLLHRLDKHTSGIVIIAKNRVAAENFREAIETHNVSKSYYARVKGDFKYESINVVRAIIVENKAKGIHTDCDWIDKDHIEKDNNNSVFNNKEVFKSQINYYATDTNKEVIISKKNQKNQFDDVTDNNKKNQVLTELSLKEDSKDSMSFILSNDKINDNKEPNSNTLIKNSLEDLLRRKTNKSEYINPLNGEKIIKPKKLEENGDGELDGDDDYNLPKYAETFFEKVFYDEASNTSVVKAHPKTGRTHQIRIHLRYLGYPIANDPCYGGIVFNDLVEFDNPDMFLIKDPDNINSKLLDKETKENLDSNNNIENINNNPKKSTSKYLLEDKSSLSVSEIYAYKIWLHAFRYMFAEYEFKTKIPPWAEKNYVINKKF